MPELFLRASGGWRGNALERYRKDRLSTEQVRFAALLSRRRVHEEVDADGTPGNLCGSLGSGMGSFGTTHSPPPSGLASGLLERRSSSAVVVVARSRSDAARMR